MFYETMSCHDSEAFVRFDMRAKDYLKQLRKLDTKINQRIAEKEGIRDSMLRTGASATDNIRVQESGSGDKLSKGMAAYLDLEAEIDAAIDEFVSTKHRIIGEIQSLEDDRYIRVLYKRYVEYKKFEVIAVEMDYSFDHVCRLHGRALLEFERCHKMSDLNVI